MAGDASISADLENAIKAVGYRVWFCIFFGNSFGVLWHQIHRFIFAYFK